MNEENKNQETADSSKKREVKVNLPLLIAIFLIIVVIAIVVLKCTVFKDENEDKYIENLPFVDIVHSGNTENNQGGTDTNRNEKEENKTPVKVVTNFDLSFLKLENSLKNNLYSPLSIKYALNMLADGTSGDSKEQIIKAIEDRDLTKYKTNANMSLANAMFIKETFKDEIKENYGEALKEKYDAEVIFDVFETPEKVNSWVSEKTLNLINNLFNDVSDKQFLLVNALGIDMEWKNKFLRNWEESFFEYKHEAFLLGYPEQVSSHKFDDEKQTVSGMTIAAAVNNYDIVKELGEDTIKQTVADEYREWMQDFESYDNMPEEEKQKLIDEYIQNGLYGEGLINELNSNYKVSDSSTDFLMHVDDNVKVFAKDLKEYEGTTLQYIGIMPTSEELGMFIKTLDESQINDIIGKLKEIKSENFKEGVVTKITGFIPKFKFDYKLNFKEDLKALGINDVFEQGKANLIKITDNEGVYITDALHKANIEFTQDGIKAAAVTVLGGGGGGGPFEYDFEVPVEEIDLTFDKPYMFLIRDKETNEIWFVGAVYEPLAWEDEPDNNLQSGT